MTQLVPDVGQRLALSSKKAGEGVSQVMESNAEESGFGVPPALLQGFGLAYGQECSQRVERSTRWFLPLLGVVSLWWWRMGRDLADLATGIARFRSSRASSPSV
jgi:hypothetical protein